jgi:hypothetical protein
MPQGHLNILEPGEHLLQRNETKPVKSTETAIVRGSLLVKENDEWRRTAATDAGAVNSPGPVCYWSLQDQDQPDVDLAKGLTAVPCNWPMLIETDQIDAGGTFAQGGYVAAGDDGKLKDHADDETAVGVVKETIHYRWSNDRLADATKGGAVRTGARISVIEVWSLYIPNLSVA